MPVQSLNHLISQGIAAAQAGSRIGQHATAEIQNDASDPQLKELLQRGNQQTQQWDQRLQQVQQMVGEQQGAQEEGGQNMIVQSIYDVSKMIRQRAKDPAERDLGIIASSQLALHYYIAAYGTLRAYCEDVGKNDAARLLQQTLDEAKQADQQHTEVAQKIARGS